MKARKVKGLDPAGPLEDNLRLIVAVRLGELEAFVPQALDPGEQTAQHDMRIAAKRLRYVLELGKPIFGEPAAEGARTARRLQDLLGEIHDCDELLPRLRAASTPPPLIVAYVAKRRAQLFERFVREWLSIDLSPIERLLQARADGGAA